MSFVENLSNLGNTDTNSSSELCWNANGMDFGGECRDEHGLVHGGVQGACLPGDLMESFDRPI
jgi:hypothetical protein